jgi:hypothetical protein
MPATDDMPRAPSPASEKSPKNEIAEKGTWWVRHTLWEFELAAQFADQRISESGVAP